MSSRSRVEGETARRFATASGKIAQARTQLGNIWETLGKPFIERAGSFADSFGKMAVAAQPLAETLAAKIAPQLEKIAAWFEEHMPDIIDWIERFAVVWDLAGKAIYAVYQEMYNFGFESYEILSKLWQNTQKEWAAISRWVDTYIIKPIYNSVVSANGADREKADPN